jgi:hypothetical protein
MAAARLLVGTRSLGVLAGLVVWTALGNCLWHRELRGSAELEGDEEVFSWPGYVPGVVLVLVVAVLIGASVWATIGVPWTYDLIVGLVLLAVVSFVTALFRARSSRPMWIWLTAGMATSLGAGVAAARYY